MMTNYYDRYDFQDMFRYNQHKDLVLLSDLEDIGVRNIAVMYIETVYKNNAKYLLILGVDIFTQKFVRLIDNFGKEYGLCKYIDDFKSVREKTVIKVPCKIYDGPFLNTLRIVGKISILGETNFSLLKKKFNEIFPMEAGFFPYLNINVHDFLSIMENNPEKEFYTRVYISSEIKQYKNKFQVKFSSKQINRFPDILDKRFLNKNRNIDGKYLRGIALVKGKNCNGEIRIYVLKIDRYNLTDSRPERPVDNYFEDPINYIDYCDNEEFEEINEMDYYQIDREMDYGYMEDEDYEE